MQRIRANAWRKMDEILTRSVLIKLFRNGEMEYECRRATVDEVLAIGRKHGFKWVFTNGEETNFVVYHGWSFSAFATIDAARRCLTPEAFAKYFPNEAPRELVS